MDSCRQQQDGSSSSHDPADSCKSTHTPSSYRKKKRNCDCEKHSVSTNLTKLHLQGRSALQLPSVEKRVQRKKKKKRDIARQQYDNRGHPVNAGANMKKKQWRHAVNDVLATVGLCVTSDADGRGRGETLSNLDATKRADRSRRKRAIDEKMLFINEYMVGLVAYWTVSLRYRLEVNWHSCTYVLILSADLNFRLSLRTWTCQWPRSCSPNGRFWDR